MFVLIYPWMVLGIDWLVLGSDEVYELYHICNRYSESSLEATISMMPVYS